MIELKNISKIYGEKESITKALDNINLKIHNGDFISIMGPSGCGKSTLLNILGCLDTQSKGEYIFKNNNISDKTEKQLAFIRNREFSFIFQNFSLIKELNVIQNIILPLEFSGKRKVDYKKINEYMDDLGILELKERKIYTLSGGQQQRVAIARALVQESNVILADEPTGALDQSNSIVITQILKMLNEKYNKTIILVTHDKNVASCANKIIEMRDGKILAS
ncbi:ABC transporter ATP-binding protein [Clostridium septicum]|uniref:ABC transporter ATP-binding protein n=1 Tax=Clostridium septicum TaxID=1504 RepID=A0A9N7JKF0_CLOSE|nr:ABC transporter ATP-binding protein [Clostridium septicum]AYE33665.1 ABC transporter ATP-binding protein [Clostridium septicum]MDU1314838.1 ABC transporter ATP-binding protein [Clostridium septicum]QAS61827.1 ABC transporter ATP-binding protein [Clostridium septicum]UEC21724.1 ABC transporter ATP-binding protein [Clostridium septicum]USS00224.1 ABC transporter ATP-binding protein [Clostridium septicum]